MKIETGYLYHIKDEFFKKVNDKGIMINHERGILDHHISLLKTEKYYGLFRLAQRFLTF